MPDHIWIALIFLRLRPVQVWRNITLQRAEFIFRTPPQQDGNPMLRDAICIVGGGRRGRRPQIALVYSRRPQYRSDQTILRMIRRQLADA